MTKRLCLLATAAITATTVPAAAVEPRPVAVETPQAMLDAKQATSLSDAIQLLQMGTADLVVVPDDQASRKLLEDQIKRPTRVRTTVRTVADLGGDGCKRLEMAFEALDIPVRSEEDVKGFWTMLMRWSVCNGGLPPEPR